MITRISEVVREKLGWCPNARTIRTAPVAIARSPVSMTFTQPDGGPSGSGRIGRGIKLATGSIRILFRNKQLLCFSVLIGLVIGFSFAASLYLQFISGTNPFPGMNLVTNSPVDIIAKGSLPWLALTLILSLITMFFMTYLLAGLIACVSRILSGRVATLREGLSEARKHMSSLAGWAIIQALGGTVYSFFANIYMENLSILFITYGFSLVFFVLTLYIIPSIVLGNNTLVTAFLESLSVFRKTWGEIIVCFGIFFLIAFGITLASVIPMSVVVFSSGSAVLVQAVAALYMLVILVIIFIGWTVVGIATFGLYIYGKTRRIPPVFEKKQEVENPV
jgi:hypothetical protein